MNPQKQEEQPICTSSLAESVPRHIPQPFAEIIQQLTASEKWDLSTHFPITRIQKENVPRSGDHTHPHVTRKQCQVYFPT